MNKKILFLSLSICALSLTACQNSTASNNPATPSEVSSSTNTVGIANPWVTCSKEEAQKLSGFNISAPEKSTNITYSVNTTDKLAQVVFTYENLQFTYRIKSATQLEDISGLYYSWDVQHDDKVKQLPAITKRHKASDQTIDLCQWYDVVPGITYSLSTSAKDLDGFDIIAIAETVFIPAQGNR